MLIAMWLLHLHEHFRIPTRMGPFNDIEDRRRVVEDLRASDPKVALLQVDVYSTGEIFTAVPVHEVA